MSPRRQRAHGESTPRRADCALAGLLALAAFPALAADERASDPAGVLAVPGVVQGDPYTIDRYTVDGGGSSASGGAFEVRGTIGQPDADPLQPSTGGDFEITGGFWPGLAPATPLPGALFANGFE